MIIVLDTGCIDFFLHNDKNKYKDFKKKIVKHEKNGDTITTTVINYGERRAGLNKFMDTDKYKQIMEFLSTVEKNDDLIFLSKKTAEIFADLRFKLKNNVDSNISKDELKSMHNDIWTASLCIEHSCKVYTDDKDFKKIKNVDKKFDFEYVAKNSL